MSLIRRRKLGNTDVELTSIGLGTWAIGGPYFTDGEPTGWSGHLNDADSIDGIVEAISGGITHIDTADVYGHGRSERLVGAAIRRVGGRENLTIASKVGFESTSDLSPFTADNINHQLNTSLKNLGTNYLDIYYLHHCDFGPDDSHLEEAANTLLGLKQSGRIRAIGLSGYGADEILRVAPVLKPDVIQTWADIEHDEILRNPKVRAFLTGSGCGFVAMMPYGQGRLLGKYRSDSPPTFGEGDNRLDSSAFTASSLQQLEPRLAQLSEKFGDSMPARICVALGYILSDELVTSVIPGFRSSRQVADLLEAAGLGFDENDRRTVEAIFPRDEMPPHPWAE